MESLTGIIMIILSSMIGASLSQIFTILAKRRLSNLPYNIWWKIKFYIAIISGGLFFLSVYFLIKLILT